MDEKDTVCKLEPRWGKAGVVTLLSSEVGSGKLLEKERDSSYW